MIFTRLVYQKGLKIVADQNKARQISEKIRQAVEKLGQSLEDWLTGTRLSPQSLPVPIDRPYSKRSKN